MTKKRRTAWHVALTVCLLIGLTSEAVPFSGKTGACVLADTTESYQDRIDAAKKKREELLDAQRELEERLSELKAQKEDMDAYIISLDKKMAELLGDIEVLEGEVTECELRLEETRLALAAAILQEEEQYDIMKRRIQYMYENPETGLFDILFGEGSLTEMFNRLEYQRQITEYDKELLERYNATKLDIANTELVLEAQLEELGMLKVTRETELAAIEELSAAKGQELVAMAAGIGADEEMLFYYWEEIISEGATIEELERLEAERVAEEERRRKEEEERRLSQSIDNMLWPIPESKRITSYFGYRKSPTAGASTYHRGIDVGAPSGTEVVASLAGTVIKATYSSSSGYYVKIDHGDGVVTSYLHASKLLVEKGDFVKRGQPVILVGSTGVSTGPHLHFGLFVNDVAVDPLDYVTYEDSE